MRVTLTAWLPLIAGCAGPELGRLAAMSSGGTTACGIDEDGELFCWGALNNYPDPLPEGRFVVVDAHGSSLCVIRDDLELLCLEQEPSSFDENEVVLEAPAGPFVSVRSDGFRACAERPEGDIECWGSETAGNINPSPGGPFLVYDQHGCAITPEGSLTCWNPDLVDSGVSPPPEGRFVALGMNFADACAVREEDLGLSCWGREGARLHPPEGRFVEVSYGSGSYCALAESGNVTCWGDPVTGGPTGVTSPFVTLDRAGDLTCAITAEGQGFCWGDITQGAHDVPQEWPP